MGKIPDGIVAGIGAAHRRCDMRADAGNHERVAVWSRAGDGSGADQASGAAAILKKELLAQSLAQLLGEKSSHQVRTAAGCEWRDDAHRLRRPVLGLTERAGLNERKGR